VVNLFANFSRAGRPRLGCPRHPFLFFFSFPKVPLKRAKGALFFFFLFFFFFFFFFFLFAMVVVFFGIFPQLGFVFPRGAGFPFSAWWSAGLR